MSLSDLSENPIDEARSESDITETGDTGDDTDTDTVATSSASYSDDEDSSETEGGEEEEAGDDKDSPWAEWVDDVWVQYQNCVKGTIDNLMVENEELSREEATGAAVQACQPGINKALRRKFLNFTFLTHRIKKDPTHQKIMETAKRAREDDGMDWEESLTYAARKRRLLFQRLLEEREPDLQQDDDEEEDEQE